MVSDVDLLKKYFVRNGDVFSGRWQNFITHMFMDGHNGIIQIQGDKWREQRRFSLHVLRDFGFGRTAMEEKIKVFGGDFWLLSRLVVQSTFIRPMKSLCVQPCCRISGSVC